MKKVRGASLTADGLTYLRTGTAVDGDVRADVGVPLHRYLFLAYMYQYYLLRFALLLLEMVRCPSSLSWDALPVPPYHTAGTLRQAYALIAVEAGLLTS